MPQPLTTTAEDGREFVAVGLIPHTGELVWVPSDTELILAPAYEYEQQDAPSAAAPEDPAS